MSEPWMFEMSKHSMRRGSTSRSSRSCRARRISCDCWRGCFHSRSKASCALRTTSSSRRSFSPRWGVRILTRVPRRCGQPLLQQLVVGHLLGHQQLAGDVAPRRVELLDGAGEHRLGLGQPVEQEALARHHLAVAHAEGLHRRPLPLPVHPEQVALLELGGGDLLRRLHPREGLHLVAQGGRLLEAVLAGRALHLARAGASPPPRCGPRGRAGRPRRTRGSGRASRPRPRRGPGSA